MIELSGALAFAALCAWDVCRRAINTKRDNRAAADYVAASARADEQDRVVQQLALDWRAKIEQMEREAKQLRDTVNGKLGSASNLRPPGYNR